MQRNRGIHQRPPPRIVFHGLHAFHPAHPRIDARDHHRAERKAERRHPPRNASALPRLLHRGNQHTEHRRRTHHARRKTHAHLLRFAVPAVPKQKDQRRTQNRHRKRKQGADASPEYCFHCESPLCHAMHKAEKRFILSIFYAFGCGSSNESHSCEHLPPQPGQPPGQPEQPPFFRSRMTLRPTKNSTTARMTNTMMVAIRRPPFSNTNRHALCNENLTCRCT